MEAISDLKRFNLPVGAPGLRPVARPIQPAPLPDTMEKVELSEGAVEARRVRHIDSPAEVLAMKAPELPRPTLMVHGLDSHSGIWMHMRNFLCCNPANKDGGSYCVDREAGFREQLRQNPEARVFTLELSENLRSPQALGGEVRRAITAILEATGAYGVDLVTHSMGGLMAREALRQGEDRVRNLVMVAPPSHGSFEATVASTLDDLHLYRLYQGGSMEAINALRLEYGPLGGVRNRWLHELNQDWPNHSGRVRASVIAGSGVPTPDVTLKGVSPGDGVVAARHAYLEGTDFYLARTASTEPDRPHHRGYGTFSYSHSALLSEPDIMQQVADLLGGQPTPQATVASRPLPLRPVPSLARGLEETAEARKSLAEAETARQVAEQWRGIGARATLAGGVLMAGGALAATAGVPGIGIACALVGLATTAIGSVQLRRNGRRAQEAADQAARTAYQALNIAEDTMHRVQREAPALRG